MARVQVLIEVGILLGSFIFGILFYYFISPTSKEEKKEQIDQVSSHLINFVIFVWAGKVIYHFKLFTQDPFAVLAYPSSAEAFYIAIVLFSGTIVYQIFRGKITLDSFLTVFTPVVIASSFVYEFIQMQFFQKNALLDLGLLIILILGYILLEKTVRNQLILIFSWATGLLIISFIAPFVMVFQFLVSPTLMITIMILSSVIFVFDQRRKDI